jgi:hypothetical protein
VAAQRFDEHGQHPTLADIRPLFRGEQLSSAAPARASAVKSRRTASSCGAGFATPAGLIGQEAKRRGRRQAQRDGDDEANSKTCDDILLSNLRANKKRLTLP